ncbi:hypothetical protein FRC20_003938 [Serendipita sp. 405]|nr:hypothetical protein FRC20_003938 [Serendipita sp. 405]
MSDSEDEDFEDSRELSGSVVNSGDDSDVASETRERPQRLKLTLKPRASGSTPSTPRTRGTGRPRGRPRGSGSGITLKVRRKQPEVVMDEVEPPAPVAASATETNVITGVAKLEAAEKGAKPGDVVIEPQQDLSHNISVDAYGKGQKESRTGIYKPGGPTTFFGSDGVGPFRGEMSSTKKAMLTRENLTEENWMHAAGLSMLEANEELRRGRAERLLPGAGLDEAYVPISHISAGATTLQYVPSVISSAPVALSTGDAMMDQFDGEVDIKALETANASSTKPVAVYEVHTGVLHYPQSMQPTKARWKQLGQRQHKDIIGGLSSVGSAAWGVARIDYVTKDEGAYSAELRRIEDLERQIADAEKNGPPPINMDWDT